VRRGWLVWMLLAATVPVWGQGGGERAPITVTGADKALMEGVWSIAASVERLRGQSFSRRPIAVRVPESMRKVAAEIRALNVLDRPRLEARGRAWSSLGLGSPSSPARLYELLSADVPGIGLDLEQHRLLVTPGRLSEEALDPGDDLGPAATLLMATGVRPDEPLLAHSLVHLRQFERDGSDALVDTTDGLLARSAWAEGEANLVAIRYLFEGLGLEDEVIDAGLDPGEFLDGELFPAGFHTLSGVEAGLGRFPYVEGFAEAARLYRLGGWERLDAAMRERHTTHQILHPGLGAEVDPDWQAAPLALPPGYALVDTDRLGEQGMIVLFTAMTDKENLALLAAQGWAGDRLERYEMPGKPEQGVTRWVSRFKSPQNATDFEYAVTRTLQTRFPAAEVEASPGGHKVVRHAGRVYRLIAQPRQLSLRIAPESIDAGWYPPDPARIRLPAADESRIRSIAGGFGEVRVHEPIR